MNYKIAVLTGYWTPGIMVEFLHGINRFAMQGTTSVFVFNSFGGIDSKSPNYIGEYNIFELPNWKDFDGVIIEGNLLMSDEIRQKVWKDVRASGVPAVVADYPLEGCPFIGVNNYKAMCEIVEHLITQHNCHIIHFISGPDWHLENQERLRAYRDTLKKFSLPLDDSMIHGGNFQIEAGMKAVDEIIERKAMPDAIVCSNDEMAIGACEALKNHGIQVPGDIRITGFDGIKSAQDYSPSITTIYRYHNGQGYEAMRMILRRIQGFDIPKQMDSEYRLEKTESCGCASNRDEFDRSLRVRHFHEEYYKQEYLEKQEILHEQILEASTLRELTDSLKKNESMFGCRGVEVFLNRDFYDSVRTGVREYRENGYPEEFVAMNSDEKIMTRKEILDFHASSPNGGEIVMCYPLHFKSRSFGFFLLNGYSQAVDRDMLHGTLTLIDLAIENLRTKKALHDYNKKLDELYVHDPLTGLYNRFGYERFGEELFGRNREEKKPMLIAFADMDRLKEINDSLGHDLGDYAIKVIADILKKVCSSRQIAVRYGGDEFLLLGSCSCESDKEVLKGRIMDALSEFNRSSPISLALGMSIGFCFSPADDSRSLGECVRIADQRMYEEKQTRKMERGKS
jgi:diguanylate cyclase (GGDEF)-like protein